MVELAGSPRTAVTDKRGAFRLDSVPLGAQRVSFSAPSLDSLGLFGFAHDINVAASLPPITLATPSFRTFHARLCATGGLPSSDSAIVFGTVYDARTRERVRGATIAIRWFAMAMTDRGVGVSEPYRTATSDETGNYGMCGVPHDLALTAYASTTSAASGDVSTQLTRARVVRRDLYISNELSGELAADSVRKGTGTLRGVVRDEDGKALVGALLVLTTTGHTTRTDDRGQWRFTGVPLGSQEVSVRQLGRGALFRTVDVVAGATADEAFVLPTATVLAAMNVRGFAIPGVDRLGYLMRKSMGTGQFLDSTQIQNRADIAAVLTQLTSLNVQRSGMGISLSGRGSCRKPLVMIDGTPVANAPTVSAPLNDPTGRQAYSDSRLETLNPRDIMAVEFHPGGTSPVTFGRRSGANCGALLIWTRLSRWQ